MEKGLKYKFKITWPCCGQEEVYTMGKTKFESYEKGKLRSLKELRMDDYTCPMCASHFLGNEVEIVDLSESQ